jgi:hypothetical protein
MVPIPDLYKIGATNNFRLSAALQEKSRQSRSVMAGRIFGFSIQKWQ